MRLLARLAPVLAVVGCQGRILGPLARSTGGIATPVVDGGAAPVTDAGSPVDDEEDAGAYAPMGTAAAVAKVKTLLTGLAPTADEVATVAANPAALRALVAQSIQLPQYQTKMLDFFSTAFQQNGNTRADYDSEDFYALNTGWAVEGPKFIANYQEMFARTALALINEGRPFTDTYTTTRFMLTPALAADLCAMDATYIDDTGRVHTDDFVNYPNFEMKLETSKGPLPSSATVDPTSPDYLEFYTPSLPMFTPEACTQDPLPYVPNFTQAFENNLFASFFGAPFATGMNNSGVANLPGPEDGGIACPVPDLSSEQLSDFEDWRMVSIRQPDAGELITPYFNLDAMRSATELVLRTPRVGFFTTPAFLGTWKTNDSNQFRVTMNQTMIVATNQAFDGADGTEPQSLAAVDVTHADQTACFQCHQQLDPMRQFFRHQYSLEFQAQTIPTNDTLAPPEFAWEGVSVQGSSIFDLGRLLGQQPRVAATWVQNLCQWANSAKCDETDPEFVRVAGVFKSSNFSWNTLVTELFSSPLVTYLAPTQSSAASGETYGISRRAHVCALLSARLGLTDACGLSPNTQVPTNLAPVQAIMVSYPSDAFTRGQVGPLLANDPTLFTRTGLENSCLAVANQVIDNGPSKYSSTQPQVAIADFAHNLMGLTGARADVIIGILQAHYSDALAQNNGDAGVVTATSALRSTFAVACLSPYVAGVGQ